MRNKTVIILSILVIAAVIFFYPKSCGEASGKSTWTETNCGCLGFKKTVGWPEMVDITKNYCYGICLKNSCKNSSGQLVGGCAGVYYIYWDTCCENYTQENNISHAQCVGNWTVEDNECKWNCS